MRLHLPVSFLTATCLLTFSGCAMLCPPTTSSGRRLTVRVGTYNVENLFDEYDDPEKFDDPASSDEKLQALADVILAANCDILALQEVENLGILRRFDDEYLGGLYPEIVLIEGNDPRGIDVAVLSKIPVSGITSFRDWDIQVPELVCTIRFPRDLVRVQWIDPTGRPWNILTTHLKSGMRDTDEVLRQAQTDAIAEICREQAYVTSFGRGLCILAGDLNCEPWTDDLRILSGVPFSDPGRDLPYRQTHAGGKTLDYILLSPDADRHYVPGSYTVFRQDPSALASDHFLVFLDLSF